MIEYYYNAGTPPGQGNLAYDNPFRVQQRSRQAITPDNSLAQAMEHLPAKP
jgi:hypothetical protein